jgi:peroxiredoxin
MRGKIFLLIIIFLCFFTHRNFGQNIEKYFPFKSIINFTGGVIRDNASISGNEMIRLSFSDTINVVGIGEKPYYKVSYKQTVGFLSESSIQVNDSLRKINEEFKRIQLIEKRKAVEGRKLKLLTKNMVGETAPNFKLANLSGKEVELSDYSGKVILLEFWGAGCGPCITIAKELEKKKKILKENNIKLLIIEQGTMNSINNVKSLVDKHGVNKKTLVAGREVAREYGVKGFPSFFLIDKNGVIAFSHVGSDLLQSPIKEDLFYVINNNLSQNISD